MTPNSLISAILLLAAVGLILTLIFRYLSIKKQYEPLDSAQGTQRTDSRVDINGFAQRLARMIQIPTVSWTHRSKRDLRLFSQFQEELITLYPGVHETLKREVHGNFGIVYHWKGKNPDRQPVLFLAHCDVVPAEEKGMVTFKITTPGKSGHSSMPDREGTAISRLARGIVHLEQKKFPSRLDPVMRNMLERFVPHVSPALGVVFANLWLFSHL